MDKDTYNETNNDLRRFQTSSLSISPELFEKLYLSPKNEVKGDLRKTFGNPTPLALVGFTVALSPLSAELMGWRGATGAGATVGANIFFGGMLLLIAGILEFFLGNTFPFIVFMGYGAHFLTYAATFQPFYGAVSLYTTDGSQTQTPAFLSSFAFYAIFMAVLSFVFLVCSLRTNGIFVMVFIGATLGFTLAAAAFWSLSAGHLVGLKLVQGAGGCFFVSCMFGWYLLAVIMFAEIDIFTGLPVFDLSTMITGASQKAAKRDVEA